MSPNEGGAQIVGPFNVNRVGHAQHQNQQLKKTVTGQQQMRVNAQGRQATG